MPENIASSIADKPDYTKNPTMGTQKQGSNLSPSFCNNLQIDNPTRTSWNELGWHNYIKILVITGLFTYLFRNEIGRIVNRWLSDSSSWGHGFLIPLFSLYFINQYKKEILSLKTRPNYLGLFFLVCGIAFYAINGASPSGYAYLQPISMIAILGAIVLFLCGWRLIKYTWLPIAFLVFAVPLPQRYYVAITMPMRHLAAEISAALLNLLSDLEATASGVIIDVIYKGQHLEPLNVAEACSGMRLLMAFLALGVAMAYLHYRPIWQRIILLASTIPIAILCNILRVTITGFIYVLIHPKYTQGIYHDILGLGMLPLAFAFYGLLAWFMSSLFIEENEEITDDIVVRRKQ
jgi:exosortase